MDYGHIDPARGEPPAEWPEHFQGEAVIQPLPTPFPEAVGVFAVHFRAGGRSRPHVHSRGQVLHVVSGRGLVGDAAGRRQVGPGDVVAAAPGEWHWHGAVADQPMTHVTVQPAGDVIDWTVEERDWAEGYGDGA